MRGDWVEAQEGPCHECFCSCFEGGCTGNVNVTLDKSEDLETMLKQVTTETQSQRAWVVLWTGDCM